MYTKVYHHIYNVAIVIYTFTQLYSIFNLQISTNRREKELFY